MIYKYEMACKEAGLSEEQTAEIRKFFDGEKKKMKRDMERRERAGIVFNSLRGLVEEYDLDEYEVPDQSFDMEEMILHKLELEKLNECMDELPVDDREFLFALFSGGYGTESELARRMDIPRQTLQRRKDRLVKQLREKFFEKN
jgi:DNA-directed RNA polymerase specialized sigma24 family protein